MKRSPANPPIQKPTNPSLPLSNCLFLTNGYFGTGVVDFTESATTNLLKFYRLKSP